MPLKNRVGAKQVRTYDQRVGSDHQVIGKVGRLVGAIAPGRMGEVMIPIRGGSESYFAYADDFRLAWVVLLRDLLLLALFVLLVTPRPARAPLRMQ